MDQINEKINGINNNTTPIKSIEERRREENNRLMEEQDALQRALAARQNMSIGETIAEQNYNRYFGQNKNVLTPPQAPETTSRLDENIRDIAQMEDIAEARGQLQSGLSQVVNGIGKGAVYAGTTFADGVIGGIAGILYATINAISEKSKDGFLTDLIRNPFSMAMQQINEASESWLPNYYTEEENKKPWHEKIFTANFIGDHFIKNFGFTIGAIYSGKISSGAMSKVLGMQKARNAFKGVSYVAENGKTISNLDDVLRAIERGDKNLTEKLIVEGLEREAKAYSTKNAILRWTGSLTAGAGEARIEAIQNTNDWFKNGMNDVEDYFGAAEKNIVHSLIDDHDAEHPYIKRINKNGDPELMDAGKIEFELRRRKILDDKNKAIEQLAKERAAMANNIFLLNLPIITLQDAWTFGRFFTGGYKEAKKFTELAAKDIAKSSLEYTNKALKKQFTLKGVAKAAGTFLSEGTQEMLQQSVATGSGYHGSAMMNKLIEEFDDPNGFYKSKFDPDVEADAETYFNAILNGTKDVFGDWNQWEQFAIGAVTSLLGVPTFTNVRDENGQIVRDENGKTKKRFQVQGEFWDSLREARDIKRQSDKITEELNNIVHQEDFVERWQNFIRHNKLEEIKAAALNADDIFSYKNTEASQIISDITAFNNAGRLDDLYEMIESVENINENDTEQVEALAANTINKETGKSAFDGHEKEMVGQMKQNATRLRKFVDSFAKVQRDLETLYGEELDPDTKESLTWQIMTIEDSENRIKEILDKISEPLYKLISNYNYLHPDSKISERPNLADLSNYLQNEDSGYLNKLVKALNDYDSSLDSAKLKRRLNQLKKQSKSLAALKEMLPTDKLDDIEDEDQKEFVKSNLDLIDKQIASLGESIEQLVAMQAGFRSGEWKDVTGINMRELGNNLKDIVRLASRRRNFIDTLSQMAENPGLFTAEAVKARNEYLDKVYEKKAGDFIEKVSIDTTATEFKNRLNELTARERQSVIKKIKSGDNATLKQYVEDLEGLEAAEKTISDMIKSDMDAAKSERRRDVITKGENVLSQIIELSTSVNDLIKNIGKFCNINQNVKGRKLLVNYVFEKASALAAARGAVESQPANPAPAANPEPAVTPSKTPVDNKDVKETEIFSNVNADGNGTTISAVDTKYDDGRREIIFVRRKIKNGVVESEQNIGVKLDVLAKLNSKFSDLVLDGSSSFNIDGAEIVEIKSIVDDGSQIYKADIVANYKDADGNLVSKGTVKAILKKKDTNPQPKAKEKDEIKTKDEGAVAHQADEHDAGGSAAVIRMDKEKDILEEFGAREQTPMSEIDSASLRNSPIPVYSIEDLKDGRLIENVITDSELFKGYVNFLLSHRSQEFIDFGGLEKLNAIHRRRHNEDLKIYFGTNPTESKDNIFRQVSKYKDKDYVHYNIALLAEIENIDDFKEFTSGDNPVFTKDNLITIDGKTYMPIGILADPPRQFREAKKAYDLISNYVKNDVDDQTKGMTNERKNRMFLGHKSRGASGPLFTNIEIGFSGRPLKNESTGDGTNFKSILNNIAEYEKYYGPRSYGFAIIRSDNGYPYPTFTDDENLPAPPFELAPGSLYFVGKGANGEYNYLQLQVKRADEFDIYNMPDNKYASEIRGLLEVIADKGADRDVKIGAVNDLGRYYVYLPMGYSIDFSKKGVIINGQTYAWGSPQNIWNKFAEDRLRMQVKLDMLNRESRRDIIESGVIESDYKSFIRRGANFNVSLLQNTKNGVEPVHLVPSILSDWISTQKGGDHSYQIKMRHGNKEHTYVVEENGSVYETSAGVSIQVFGELADIVKFKGEVNEITRYTRDGIISGVSTASGYPNIKRYSMSTFRYDDSGHAVPTGEKTTREVFVKNVNGRKLYARREGVNNISVVMPENTDLIDELNAFIMEVEEKYGRENNAVKTQENAPSAQPEQAAEIKDEVKEVKKNEDMTVDDMEASFDDMLSDDSEDIDDNTNDTKIADDTSKIDQCNIKK